MPHGIHGVEDHQPGIVNPAIGIDKALGEQRLQRHAGRMVAQVNRGRCRQDLAPRQVIVEEQAQPDHPDRAQRTGGGIVRHHEAQWPHDVGRTPEQYLALGQRLANQGEFVILQIAQTAMDELGAA